MSHTLTVDLIHIPSKLSHRTLGSASDYIITSQCLRTLVRLGEAGGLEGDVAQSWSVSQDHKTFIFSIKPDVKFSNGDLITPDDIAESLNHPDFRKISIHFDFSNIKSIEANERAVTIQLTKKVPQFINHLTRPEFGVFHKSDREGVSPTLKVSSGPFYIEGASPELVLLKANPHCTEQGPKEIKFVALKGSKFKALEEGSLNMALLWEDPTKEAMDRFMGLGTFDIMRPHVGFTFWVSLNPNSENMADLSLRRHFQLSLKKNFGTFFKATPSWDDAGQLFLPGGPGRISQDWVAEFWSQEISVVTPKKMILKGLVSSTFPFSEDLEKAISETSKDLKVEFQLTTYNDQTEFLNLLRETNWDFYLINNDFSSYELTKNLIVTFNKAKPLIQMPAKDPSWKTLWKNTQISEGAKERYENIEILAKKLLEDALIVPLAYKSIPIIKQKKIDLSLWSNLFPEFAFWKVRIKSDVART